MQRAPEDRQVLHDRPVVDVVEVEAHRVVPREVGAAGDLPEAGEARADVEATLHVDLVATHLGGQGGPGADEAHVAGDDVEQLRELVERQAADDRADPGDAGVVLGLEEHAPGILVEVADALEASLRVDHHAPELEALEELAVAADPRLAEDHGTAVLGLDEHRDGDHDRQREDEQDRGPDDVERALEPPGRVQAAGLLDVDERQAADRSHVHPTRGDVAQAGHDRHLHVVALEVPGDVTEVGGGREGALGEDDEVGLLAQHGVGRLGRAPDDGRAPRGDRSRISRRQHRPDDLVAEPALPREDRDDVVDVARGPGDDDPRREPPLLVGAVDGLAGRPPPRDEQRDADDEDEHEEAARQLELGEVGRDPDQPGGDAGRREDAGVLGRADPEVGPGVGTGQGVDEHPAGDDPQRDRLDRQTELVVEDEEVETFVTQRGQGGRDDDEHGVSGRDGALHEPDAPRTAAERLDHRSSHHIEQTHAGLAH